MSKIGNAMYDLYAPVSFGGGGGGGGGGRGSVQTTPKTSRLRTSTPITFSPTGAVIGGIIGNGIGGSVGGSWGSALGGPVGTAIGGYGPSATVAAGAAVGNYGFRGDLSGMR